MTEMKKGIIIELIKQLIHIKDIADNKITTLSCQGQGMDGYTELAEYRNIIEKLRKTN